MKGRRSRYLRFCRLRSSIDSSVVNMLRTSAVALGLLASVSVAAPLVAKDCNSSAAAPVAHVKNGSYAGVHSPEYNQDFFLGIPYAQPPVGDLRFKNPVSLNESWTGQKQATQYSKAVCIVPANVVSMGSFVLTKCVVLWLWFRSVELRGIRGLPVPQCGSSRWIRKPKSSCSLLDPRRRFLRGLWW